MGRGAGIAAGVVGAVALVAGLWPVTAFAALYIVFSFRRPNGRRADRFEHGASPAPGRPRARFVVGALLVMLSGVALLEGGTYSPALFFMAGLSVLFLPSLVRRAHADQVVAVDGSVLLRSRFFPLRWYALAEVKLETRDGVRGVASMDGRVLVFAGNPLKATQVVRVLALSYRRAEGQVVMKLRKESETLARTGTHLIPLDSHDSYQLLSHRLGRIGTGPRDADSASLPFDVFSLDAKEGFVVRQRAYRVEGGQGAAVIPEADVSNARPPLLAELVDGIGEKHGWPQPDEYSPFLASLDASRAEPLGDRFRTKGGDGGTVNVEAPGGAEVRLTKAQLRMVVRIYA